MDVGGEGALQWVEIEPWPAAVTGRRGHILRSEHAYTIVLSASSDPHRSRHLHTYHDTTAKAKSVYKCTACGMGRREFQLEPIHDQVILHVAFRGMITCSKV